MSLLSGSSFKAAQRRRDAAAAAKAKRVKAKAQAKTKRLATKAKTAAASQAALVATQNQQVATTLAGLAAQQQQVPVINFPELPEPVRIAQLDPEASAAERRMAAKRRGKSGGSAQKTGLVQRT